MNGTIDIRIEGHHGSISDLKWRDVPPFAVITGVNGTGKSQLLEIMASTYGALGPRYPQGSRVSVTTAACAVIEGDQFVHGEVFHSYGEWSAPEAAAVTEQEVKEAVRHFYNVTLTAARQPVLPQVHQQLAEDFIAKIGVAADEVAQKLSLEQFYENLTPGQLWAFMWPSGGGNLAFMFLSYLLFEKDARAQGKSEEDARSMYGEPPGLLLNEILEVSGLPLQVDYPESIRPSSLVYEPQFVLRLRDVERGIEIPFEGLSSGERVIMSTMLWRYRAQQGIRHPRLLLLDEPDAHLHPSLTRRFLEVIRKVFVEERGVRVIMTTHSPSTVSLAPENSLFEMRRTHPRIQPATSKANAVAVLTDGFVAVQEATQTILLEGKDDPPFYKQVWDLLTERSGISEPGPLEPYPGLAFVYGQGKNTVELIVPQMRSHGLLNFHGIIDRDDSNAPSDGVHVVGRNGMENYLFDPLNIWLLLHSKDQAPDVPGANVPRGREAYIRNLPEDQLQQIAGVVLVKVEGTLPDLRREDRIQEEVFFVSGKRLHYPRWLLDRDDKTVACAFRQAFGQHLVTVRGLLRSYVTLNMVPRDLLDLFRMIQNSGKP